MRFSESDYCRGWLDQFDAIDALIAKSVIDSMWFVSAREVELALWENIRSTIGSSTTKKVALYPVSNKKPGHFGSEHKIGYLLEALKECLPTGGTVNPTESDLLSGNYSHVFIVEDIAGSGGTLHDFCKSFITPKLRSRLSSKSKRLELHISCYCAYDHAIKRTLSASKSLRADHFHTCIRLNKNHSYFSETQIDFLTRIRKQTEKKFPPLGYKRTGCPVVFEYSCPNNTPAILHHNGPVYRALFPNKKIPAPARPFFDEVNRTPIFNLLTRLGVDNLQKISELNIKRKNDFADFTAYLKLFSRGVDFNRFQRYLIHTTDKINETRERLLELGLIDTNNRISLFGKDILKKITKKPFDPPKNTAQKKTIYIPQIINKISRGNQ